MHAHVPPRGRRGHGISLPHLGLRLGHMRTCKSGVAHVRVHCRAEDVQQASHRTLISKLSFHVAPQEQRAAKAEAYKLQTALMEKDAALQRKDVEVRLPCACSIRSTCRQRDVCDCCLHYAFWVLRHARVLHLLLIPEDLVSYADQCAAREQAGLDNVLATHFDLKP